MNLQFFFNFFSDLEQPARAEFNFYESVYGKREEFFSDSTLLLGMLEKTTGDF